MAKDYVTFEDGKKYEPRLIPDYFLGKYIGHKLIFIEIK